MGDDETPTLDFNSIGMKLSLCSSCILVVMTLVSCVKSKDTSKEGTYIFDADFLRKHIKNVIELSKSVNQAKVLPADHQGPALVLRAGESARYRQSAFHFEGDFEKLNVLAKTYFRLG